MNKINKIFMWEILSFISVICFTAFTIFFFNFGIESAAISIIMITLSILSFGYCINKRDKELENKLNKEKEAVISRENVDSI